MIRPTEWLEALYADSDGVVTPQSSDFIISIFLLISGIDPNDSFGRSVLEAHEVRNCQATTGQPF